ncbi:hypothetical protein Syun_017586 [Stephania yunnanensis]|uniref:Ribonuclease H1 N-terminal domain-containing protein n=1 Tax=Stephania yunnanensis TaxID=152371 RepID=A0AAP0J770_9MAGN
MCFHPRALQRCLKKSKGLDRFVAGEGEEEVRRRKPAPSRTARRRCVREGEEQLQRRNPNSSPLRLRRRRRSTISRNRTARNARSLLGSDQFGKTMKIDEIDESDESDEYGKLNNWKWYTVFCGWDPGVYGTWYECYKQGIKFDGFYYAHFDTKEEAIADFDRYNHAATIEREVHDQLTLEEALAELDEIPPPPLPPRLWIEELYEAKGVPLPRSPSIDEEPRIDLFLETEPFTKELARVMKLLWIRGGLTRCIMYSMILYEQENINPCSRLNVWSLADVNV